MHNLSFGLGFLIILGMQDIQEQQEAIKKKPSHPLLSPQQRTSSFAINAFTCRRKRCLYWGYKGACTIATRCLYWHYKMLVLALQGACTTTTKGLVLGLQDACSATENNITPIHDRLHEAR